MTDLPAAFQSPSTVKYRLFCPLREYQIFVNNPKSLKRELDIVYRCYIYEICKSMKEYNVLLKNIHGKNYEVHDVIKKAVTKTFIYSRVGDYLQTELDVSFVQADQRKTCPSESSFHQS